MNARQQVATQEPVAEKPMVAFRNQLRGALPTIVKLLPAHITREKFEAMVIGAIIGNQDLLKADRGSLMQAVADTADLGLSLNKQMREADILLVQGKAQMRPRYEGLVKLARQSGEIIDVYAHEVYENDTFHYVLGLNKDIVHEAPPNNGDRGALTQQAYCVWMTKDHVKGFEVIGPKRIARAKAASEGYKAFKAGKIKSTPWVEDEAQMIRKTAIRAAAPYMPKSTESDKFQRALAMSDDTSFADVDHIGATASTPVIPPPRPTRKSAAAARDAAERDERQRQDGFRGAVGDQGAPAHDSDTGEIHGGQGGIDAAEESEREEEEPPADEEDHGDPRPREEPEPKKQPAKQAAKAAAAPPKAQASFTDPARVRERLLKQLIAADNGMKLTGFLKDYEDEIAYLKENAGGEYDKVMRQVDGKKRSFGIK